MGFYTPSKSQCGFIQADKFNNIWVVNHSIVLCFDKEHKKVGSYSNLILGSPNFIDALDPFRVLVFYKESQTIVVLNNKVSEISKPIYFREKGVNDVSLVCRSNKGGFWVFNRINWEIIHFDSGFNQTGEKIILETTSSDSSPLYMVEYNGVLYVAFKNMGIIRYDSYGAYLGIIPIKTNNFFNIYDGSIFYINDRVFFKYNLENNEIKSISTLIQCLPVNIQGEFLFFDGSGIAVHKIR